MNALMRIQQAGQRIDAPLATWLGSLLLLGLRWHVAWQFFKAALLRISNWPATLVLFRDVYKVPALPPDVAASLGVFGAMFFPLLLFLGLLSRTAALGLFCVDALAMISYPQIFGFDCPAELHDHVAWGVALLVVIAFGPGRFAIDAWLRRVASGYL